MLLIPVPPPFAAQQFRTSNKVQIMSDKPRKQSKPTASGKNTTPAFFKGEFSFVHKDASNIDSKDHNTAVSWHVMNRYERWKKQEQAKRLRASATTPTNATSSTLPVATQPDEAVYPSGYVQPPAVDRPLTNIDFGATTAASSSLTLNKTTAFTSAASTPSTSSSSQGDLFSQLVDEADTLAAAATITEDALFDDNDVSHLIKFAYQHYSPSLWPVEPGNVCSSYEIGQSWDEVTAMNQDYCYEKAFHALLALVSGRFYGQGDCWEFAQRLRAQGVTELRNRMAQPGPPTLLTLKAMLKLFCFESVSGNTANARTYLKMLRSQVVKNGGIVLLEPWLREDLLSCDVFFALRHGTRPQLPAAEWSPGPLSQSWRSRLQAADIYLDQNLSVDKLIENQTIKTIMLDLRELFKIQEFLLEHKTPLDDPILRWRQLRKCDCMSRLADHYINLVIYEHLHEFPKTQLMLTAAIQLYTIMILGSPEPVTLGRALLERLSQRATEAESEIEETGSYRLLLWALYVGSLAEQLQWQSGPPYQSCKARLDKMVIKMRLQIFEDMERIFRQILFSALLHAEILGGRVYRTSDFQPGLYSICGTSWRQPATLTVQSPPPTPGEQGKGVLRE